MIVIGRPINGVSLNGNEYAKNDRGVTFTFKDEEEAYHFLHEHGISENDIKAMGIVFETIPDNELTEGGKQCQQHNSYAQTERKSRFSNA